MKFNDLPDDCLSAIFNQSCDLEHLLDFAKVCSRWRNLILIRLKKFTILASWSLPVYDDQLETCVHTNNIKLLEKIEVSKFLPNIKMLELTIKEKCGCGVLANLLSTSNQIDGLVFKYLPFQLHKCDIVDNHLDQLILPYLGNIEYLSTSIESLYDRYFQTFGYKNKLKRLGDFFGGSVDLNLFKKYSEYIKNLEQLFISDEELNLGSIFEYKMPVMHKLTHLFYSEYHPLSFSIKFVDSCPNLESLYLMITDDYLLGMIVDEKVVNYNVKELSIMLGGKPKDTLERILKKFPNLTFLSIECAGNASDSLLIKIIEMLPNLTFLDIRCAFNRNPNKRSIIEDFCHSQNRKMDFYYDQNDQSFFDNKSYKKIFNSFYGQYTV